LPAVGLPADAVQATVTARPSKRVEMPVTGTQSSGTLAVATCWIVTCAQ
jgi:hypothetical protein